MPWVDATRSILEEHKDEDSDYGDEPPVPEMGPMMRKTVAWRDAASFLKSASSQPAGSLAYVMESDELLVKLSQGWRRLMIGSPPTWADDKGERMSEKEIRSD
uniref:Protein containing Endostatin domain n=1 Tax=Rhipicephalus zambeziensis TaxID=60191 RepID=A0A224Z0F0_9ACAR